MITPYLPYPLYSGGQIRSYNLLKNLAKSHEITLFAFVKEVVPGHIKELEKFCKKIEVFKRRKAWSVVNILVSGFSFYPFLVAIYYSLSLRERIREELFHNKYDLIHAETFYVMPHLGKTSVPTILVEQTIWHDVYKHHVVNEIPFFLRPFFMQDVLKVKFWEKYYWSKADRLFAVSEEDRDAMLALVPKKEVGIIPNGVDCHFFTEKRREKRLPPRILYGVTNFEWLQNQEATKILIEEVWPRIKKVNPNAKVWIVGRKMPYWLKNLSKNEDIEVTENIPDARDAYRRASVMVAPIKGAGGTRLKILEAMAAGLPVISTSVGVAGLKLTDKVNVLIADTPEEIAERTIMLLKDERLSEIIGEAGRKHVQKNFDWESIVKLHDPVYRELAKRK